MYYSTIDKILFIDQKQGYHWLFYYYYNAYPSRKIPNSTCFFIKKKWYLYLNTFVNKMKTLVAMLLGAKNVPQEGTNRWIISGG